MISEVTEGHTPHSPIPEYCLGLADDLSEALIGLGANIKTEPVIWNALGIGHNLCLTRVSTGEAL